ncbi:hypothetical protein [Sideroxydans sp. CL21]|nr:hypothetical protein [Sideroxydans sp. CL21]
MNCISICRLAKTHFWTGKIEDTQGFHQITHSINQALGFTRTCPAINVKTTLTASQV